MYVLHKIRFKDENIIFNFKCYSTLLNLFGMKRIHNMHSVVKKITIEVISTFKCTW